MTATHEQSRLVGQRIAATRQRFGLSARDLAERLGWPRDTLVNFELGRRAITIERLQAIAAALDVPAAALLADQTSLAALLVRLSREPHLINQLQRYIEQASEHGPLEGQGAQ